MQSEELFLASLIHNEEYMRVVLPHLKEEYFPESYEKVVFGEIYRYVNKFNATPTVEALTIALNDRQGLSEDQYKNAAELIAGFKDYTPQKVGFLVEETEKWCQERALYNALMRSIKITNDPKAGSKQEIPDILSEALRVSFDTKIGHDFINDHESRYDFYHNVEHRISSGLDFIDKVTNGGFPKKTLNVFLAGTNVGKTLIMCSLAANALMAGKNVLYITMEMAEEAIAQRVDQNLLDMTLEDLMKIDRDEYETKFQRKIAKKFQGRLIIKEYPTASAHVGHFRHVIKELRVKKNFEPDIIFVDYLGIMASQRVRLGGTVNSYNYVKYIAEELRGLAKEFEVPIVTGAQTNRGGQSETDLDLDDTAESMGLPHTADFMLAIVETEELAEMNQFLCKQLKNRYRDKNKNRRFVIGVDKDRQRLYDLDDSAQVNVQGSGFEQKKGKEDDDVPLFDKSASGRRLATERKDLNWG